MAVGPKPIHAGNESNDLELLDLMVEPADSRFLEFEAAPRGRVLVGEGLDDFLNLPARGDAFLLQLQEGFVRRRAGFVGVLKHAELVSPSGVSARVCLAIATARWLNERRSVSRGLRCRCAAEAPQDFTYNVADERFG